MLIDLASGIDRLLLVEPLLIIFTDDISTRTMNRDSPATIIVLESLVMWIARM